MPFKSEAQRKFMYANHPDIAKRWDKEFPNQGELPKYLKKKLVVNNKLKGALGASEFTGDNKPTGNIEINVAAHQGDRAELASTIKHEMMHVKNPKMTEKQVYKRTAKTKISPQEQSKLIAKLRFKKLNYKSGAMKRKFKMGRVDTKPGDFITKLNDQPKKRTAIMGLV